MHRSLHIGNRAGCASALIIGYIQLMTDHLAKQIDCSPEWLQCHIRFNSKPSPARDGQEIEAQTSKAGRGWMLRRRVEFVAAMVSDG